MILRSSWAAARRSASALSTALRVALRPPGLQALDLFGLDMMRHDKNGAVAGRQRRRLALDEFVDADDDCSPASMPSSRRVLDSTSLDFM